MTKHLVTLALALALAACGGGSDDNPRQDAAPTDGPACRIPTGFTFAAIGDRSFASFGNSGGLHSVGVPDGTPFGVAVKTCDSCDGVCTFEGPTKPQGSVERRRCLNHTRTTCETDGDCPANPAVARKCVYMYDAPTATPLVGVGGLIGACGWSYIPIAAPGEPPTVTGSLDLASGELNIQSLRVLLPLNGVGGSYRGSCAECIGDDVANDGVKNGTCTRSTRGQAFDNSPDLGMPCDVHRYGDVPGYEGTFSLDCSPTVQANDGLGTEFGGSFSSSGYQLAISASSPNCTHPDFVGEKCFCGLCPDNVTGCLSNADCGGAQCGYTPPDCDPNPYPYTDTGAFNAGNFNPMYAPGQCRGPGTTSTMTVAGNSCRNKQCNWDPVAGKGTCISRLNNQTLGCYPAEATASIVSPGGIRQIGGVFIADTASARCNRATPSPALNAQLGLPGLFFQKRSFRILPEYAP